MPSADAAEGVAEGVAERAALWQAAKLGKLKEVKAALDATVVDLDDIDVEGNTLLHMAASQGHKLLVKELLRRGADAQVINFAFNWVLLCIMVLVFAGANLAGYSL